ncbi:hypothetical protein CEXT_777301 [Caerostris extrusa]|uniref:Uncharacterized protein n=1 Tax=Caerostris extrusa TaxID=172846 RepID=A0AAV4Q6R2_CAEEX|nr:hypothetical protein CEXT_777301 [Caerostris extrusa]
MCRRFRNRRLKEATREKEEAEDSLTPKSELRCSLGGIEVVGHEALEHALVVALDVGQVNDVPRRKFDSGPGSQGHSVLHPLDRDHGMSSRGTIESGRLPPRPRSALWAALGQTGG